MFNLGRREEAFDRHRHHVGLLAVRNGARLQARALCIGAVLRDRAGVVAMNKVKRPTEEATQGIEHPVGPRPLVEERIGSSGPLLKPGIGSSDRLLKPGGPVVIRPGAVP